MRDRVDLRTIVLVIAGTISATIVVLAITFYFAEPHLPPDRRDITKDTYDLVVTRTLLPLFNSLVGSALVYIFGKPLAAAAASWLMSAGARNPSDV